MKTTMIIGNGFNNMVAGIIRQIPDEWITSKTLKENKIATADNIMSITKLWEEFDVVFNELAKEMNNFNHEELIKMIYSVINLFSSLNGFTEVIGKDKIDEIRALFGSFLVDKIVVIASKFREHENIDEYKSMKKYLSNFATSVLDHISTDPNNRLNIYTTNYDGVLDTLMTVPRTENRNNGFIGADGFTNPVTQQLLGFVAPHLDNKKICLLHLHGSYKFTKNYGETFKLRGGAINNEPVMVFNNPNMKESIIRRDNVLSYYFDKLREDLINTDRLVIIGNSMKAEPHIKNLFQLYLNKSAEVVVCSRNPNEISQEIKQYIKRPALEISTSDIHYEADLISFFKAMIVTE